MNILKILEQMLLPRICPLCQEAVDYERENPLCDECEELWQEYLSIKCHTCGYKSKDCTCLPKQIKEINNSICVWCIFYTPKAKNDVNKLFFKAKRKYNIELLKMFARYMKKNLVSFCISHKINYNEFEITFVPRRRRKRKQYGFDHAEKLAKYLAKMLGGIKVNRALVNKGRKEQKRLNKQKRIENAKKSYRFKKNADVKNKKLFLVDDIITSGSSMKSCAELLYQNGAAAVIPVAFAKDNN